MKLPKIDVPLFDLVIPSTKQKVQFRPFLVKEEKVLLIALESNQTSSMIRAVKQIIKNCIVEEVDVDNLAMFDIEYIFIKLRAKSVNNVVKLSYRDNEDNKVYQFEVDLDTLEVRDSGKHKEIIEINKDLKLYMRYPSVTVIEKYADASSTDAVFGILIECLDRLVNTTTKVEWKMGEVEEADKKEFLESLNVNTMNEVRNFIETMPSLYHELNYTNAKGESKKIVLNKLVDFFTLG